MERPDFTVENLPAGFSWDKYKIEVSGDKIKLVVPMMPTWTKELTDPVIEPDRATGKDVAKYIIAGAIPKTATKLIEAIKAAEAEAAKNAGIKNASFPSFLRDGADKDSSGNYIKQGGRLKDFHYFSAKTKKQPRVLERGTASFIDADPASVYAGGFCVLSGTLLFVGWGSDAKKGSSLWFNQLLWCGGGTNMGGGGSSAEDDFSDYLDGGTDAGDELL